MPSGPTRSLTLRSPRSRTTSRSIPTASTRSANRRRRRGFGASARATRHKAATGPRDDACRCRYAPRRMAQEGDEMVKTTPAQNKALVLQAFDTLFNKRDYKAAERYWSSNYIQHSAHIPPGRDGLFNLIRSSPAALRYEPGLIVAEDDYVIVHGRFSGTGRPRSWIAADVVRVTHGMLAEHWDVLQDEAAETESRSGLPMFGITFPE